MRRILAPLLIALVLCVSCNPLARPNPAATATPSPEVTETEYVVYKALIETMYPTDSRGMIVIHDYTSQGLGLVNFDANKFDYIKKQMPELDRALWDSFQAQNTASRPLEDRFNLKVPVTLLSQTDFDAFFGKNGKGWDDYYLQYPKSQGILDLSRVGFNAKGDRALVYAGNQSYALAGAGYAVLLGLEDGQWKILNQVMVWIS